MTVVVIVAHPDDEVLGCGGTIARCSLEGHDVHVLILTRGVTSRFDNKDWGLCEGYLSELTKAANEANKILGVKSLTIEGFPDNRLDSVDRLDLIKRVEMFIEKMEPKVVYTHHACDLNIDHRYVHEAVITSCRPVPGSSVETLLFFEVPSSTEWQIPTSAPCFAPNWFVDISGTLDRKLLALKKYEMEMRSWPHPRSLMAVEHLAKWRGACAGVGAAEGFILGRRLEGF